MERDLEIRHNTAAEPGLRPVYQGVARGGGGPGRPSPHPSPEPPPRCPICGRLHESRAEAFRAHGIEHDLINGDGHILRWRPRRGEYEPLRPPGTFKGYNAGTVDVDALTFGDVTKTMVDSLNIRGGTFTTAGDGHTVNGRLVW